MGKITTKKLSKSHKTNSSLRLPAMRKLYFRPSQIILTILGLVLAIFFLRVAIWEHNYLKRMEGSERATAEAYDDGGEEVETDQPTTTAVATYTVAADKPRYLTIPSLNGIDHARIVEIGTKNNGALATPYNIYDVGWYTGSSLPGATGTAIIDGHGGRPGVGVFGNLTLIKLGAVIEVEMGDGRLYTYKVVDTATKALGEEADAYMLEAFHSPEKGKSSLTLITCTGDYWLKQRTYSHRFFVRAVLMDSEVTR